MFNVPGQSAPGDDDPIVAANIRYCKLAAA